jgi:hypothetical protein
MASDLERIAAKDRKITELETVIRHLSENQNIFVGEIDRLRTALTELETATATWLAETGPMHINTNMGRSRTQAAMGAARAALTRPADLDNADE